MLHEFIDVLPSAQCPAHYKHSVIVGYRSVWVLGIRKGQWFKVATGEIELIRRVDTCLLTTSHLLRALGVSRQESQNIHNHLNHQAKNACLWGCVKFPPQQDMTSELSVLARNYCKEYAFHLNGKSSAEDNHHNKRLGNKSPCEQVPTSKQIEL